jgi:hypothetical protein
MQNWYVKELDVVDFVIASVCEMGNGKLFLP